MAVFSKAELIRGVTLAMERHASAEMEGRCAKKSRNEQRCVLDDHFVGIMGEWAVCQELGHDFNPTMDTYKSAPDTCGFEVKTARAPAYYMIMADNDRTDCPYAMVVQISLFRYDVLGYITYDEAERVCEMKALNPTMPPARVVSIRHLRSIAECMP